MIRVRIQRQRHRKNMLVGDVEQATAELHPGAVDFHVGDRVVAAPHETPHPPWRVVGREWCGDQLTLTVTEAVEVGDGR